MTSAPTFSWSRLGLIVLGGTLGAGARAALVWPLQNAPMAELAWSTALINIVGAFALGIVVGALGARHSAGRAFLGTGILGGFTTYSAFAVQVALLVPTYPTIALAVAVLTVALGFPAAGLGLRIGRRSARRQGATDAPEAAE